MSGPMNAIRFGCLAILFLPAVLALPLSASMAQEDIRHVDDSAFVRPIRPPAVFFHDAHNAAANIDDCNVCHHVYYNGKPAPDDNSVGMECSECHADKEKGVKFDLIRVYHERCKGCHEKERAGPVMCGECHRK